MGDDVAVRVAGEAARVTRTARRRARAGPALLERMRVVAESDPELHQASEASVGERREIVERERRLGRRGLKPGPRRMWTATMPAAAAGNVVVGAVADVGNSVVAWPRRLATLSKNAGSGLRTPRLADDEMTSAGSADARAQASAPPSGCPRRRPGSRARAPARDSPMRRGRVIERVRDLVPPTRRLLGQMAPQRVVLLPSRKS